MVTHKQAVAHYYRLFRGNMERPADTAYQSARSFVHFRKRLAEMVAPKRRRKKVSKVRA